jgi:hypothetical protein
MCLFFLSSKRLLLPVKKIILKYSSLLLNTENSFGDYQQVNETCLYVHSVVERGRYES